MATAQTSADLVEPLPAFRLSDDVAAVVDQVIADNEGLRSLRELSIACCINTEKVDPDDDPEIDEIVRALKVNPLWHSLTGYDAVVWVKEGPWRVGARYREALLTHALSHVFVSEEGKVKIVGHDVEAFLRETKKFGAWSGRLANFWRSLGGRDSGIQTTIADAVDLEQHRARRGKGTEE